MPRYSFEVGLRGDPILLKCGEALRLGVSDADASLYGRDDDVHDGDGAQFSRGPTDQSLPDGRSSGREHHGLCATGQHYAVWHVHVAGESDGRRRYGCSHGRAYSHAMHSGHRGSVDSGSTDCAAGRHAYAGQHVDADVHVGGNDHVRDAGRVHGDGALALRGD